MGYVLDHLRLESNLLRSKREVKLVTTGLYGVIRNHAVHEFLLVRGLNVMWLTVIMLVCGLFGGVVLASFEEGK